MNIQLKLSHGWRRSRKMSTKNRIKRSYKQHLADWTQKLKAKKRPYYEDDDVIIH